MTHTPGPWTAHAHSVEAANGDTVAQLEPVYSVSGRSMERLRREEAANARLIAAAPELLALARTTLSYLTTMHAAGIIQGHEPWMEELQALVGKVTS